MKLLDLTLSSPAENLALDEALLESAELAAESIEYLRLWESPQYAVIIGRSSKVAEEVCLPYCQRHGIPVLRRCSGGTAVLIGPGCLMYAAILRSDLRPNLWLVDEAHHFVLDKLSRALGRCQMNAVYRGTSDLSVGDRKISGNSLRLKRQALLYHGTILYGLSADLIQSCLQSPPRQPDYRRGRAHADFVANVSATRDQLCAALIAEWAVHERLTAWPRELTTQLVQERYQRDDWNHRL